MTAQPDAGSSKLAALPKAMLVMLAGAGMMLSLLIAGIEARQYRAIEWLRINETIDRHFNALSDHLVRRENIARTVAALFRPPPLTHPHPLSQFAGHIPALVPDLTSIAWLPEISADQIPEVLEAITASGEKNAAIRGADGAPLKISQLQRPLYPIVDVLPATLRPVIGTDAGDVPERLAAIQKTRETRAPVRTPASNLALISKAPTILLYAPVFHDDIFVGVIGFGYRLDDLLRGALNTQQELPFAIRVVASEGGEILLSLPENNIATEARTEIFRRAPFAGRDLHIVYAVPRDLMGESLRRSLVTAIIGFAITGMAILLLAYISNRATVLAHEVASRREVENRLKILIHELNHRVRNVMTVAQAVVRLSFSPGYSLEEVQKTCEGRLQALASAMTLLTDSDWRSVSLRRLIASDVIPFSDRIIANGPDLALRPRAAQTFALLLYELATNAAKHGALSVPEGKVLLDWQVDRSGDAPVFRLVWLERDGPLIGIPTRRGFGDLLVRRVAPRDVAGHATISYEQDGYRYELEAPLDEVREDRPQNNKS